jgi:hypothetical protein
MADPIMTICSLAGCSEDEARAAYEKTEDVIEAIDLVLARPVCASDRFVPLPQKRKRQDITPEEKEVTKIRSTMKAFDSEMDRNLTNASNPLSPLSADETTVHHEETALQSNCLQVCRLPSIEEEVEIQEIVYPIPSGRSCDLP